MSIHVEFQPEPAPLASVIVVAWRQAPYLLECLRALAESVRDAPYEVIVVLNETTPALRAEVHDKVHGTTLLTTSVNLGFAGAVNLAADQARGAYLVLLNDDTEVEPLWLEHLIETAERRPLSGAVGSTMLFPDGTIQEAGSILWHDGSTLTVGRGLAGDSRRYDFERQVDFASGGSLLVRRATWEALGGFSPDYFPAYYEDTDLCLRIRQLGEQVWYQPRSRVMHHESTSTNPTYRNFLFERNKAVLRARFPDLLAQRVTAAPWDPAAIEEAVWRAMGAPARVLLVDDQLPMPAKGSGMPRMAEVVSLLQQTGRYQVSAWTSLYGGSDDNDLMAQLGVEVIDGPLEEHLATAGRRYAAAVFSRPHNFEIRAPLVRAAMPETKLIYDAEALFFRRIEREADLAAGTPREADLRAEAAGMKRVEEQIAAEADYVVTISEEEAALLVPSAKGPVVVHGPLLAGIEPTATPYGERRDLAFVAGWAAGPSSPNFDAMCWFVRDVLPKLRARVAGVRLLVTGIGPPEQLERLASPSVVFVGSVDLAEFYGHIRAAVVPMRFGAGVKNKTIEALQFGVPTVATSVGAEGVPLDDPDALIVADDPASFADALEPLLSDQAAWQLQQRRILAQVARWEESRPPSVWLEALDALTGARHGRHLLETAVE